MARNSSTNKVASSSLPHNSDAERAVLGSALLSRNASLNVLSSLNEDDFFEGRHQIIYRSMKNLFEKKVAIDSLTVTEELINIKELENVGGVEYLQICSDSMVALSNLEFYINIVNDQSVLRKMLLAIRKIDESYMHRDIDNVNDFIINAELEFKTSIERRKISGFKETKDVTQRVKNDIDTMVAQSRDSQNKDLIGLTTGYTRLNKLTQGFQREQMIVIAGRPGLGKTALALNFAFKASRHHDIPVAIFSLEMSSDLLVRRLIASEACVDLTRISTGNLSESDRTKVASAINTVANTKIFIDDSPGLKLTDIVAKAKKLQSANPDLGMVIIDYLGLIQLTGKGKGADSRQEEVRKITLALKDLSRELKLPVIVLSQLSRDVEKRDSKRPMLSDLRDSGSIEQDADIVMLLYREDYYDKNTKKSNFQGGNKTPARMNEGERTQMSRAQRTEELLSQMPGSASYVEINVAKNRNGQTGKAALLFYKAYGRFDTPSQDWEDAMNALTEDSMD